MSGRQLIALVLFIIALGAVATYLVYGSLLATPVFN